MISKQSLNKHWINNSFLSIGLFLIISFLLPFAAEGTILDIGNEYCDGSEEEKVYFNVWVSNAGDPVEKFRFTVTYDDDILEYEEYFQGGVCNRPVIVDMLSPGTLRISGANCGIDHNEDGELVELKFIVKKCEKTTLKLTNKSGDFDLWNSSNGYLRPEDEKSESSLGMLPRFIPPVPVYPGSVYSSLGLQGLGYQGYGIYQGLGNLGIYSGLGGYQGFGFPGYGIYQGLGNFGIYSGLGGYQGFGFPGYGIYQGLSNFGIYSGLGGYQGLIY
ncbi:MAG: cohesin domain-containing protein [bacterium]